jgi:hypothetical protein
MKVIPGVLLGGAMMLVSVGLAVGQGVNPNASGAASSSTSSSGAVEVPGPVDAQGSMQATTDAEAKANADAEQTLNRIRERARKASAKLSATIQKQLADISREIDAEANEKGDVVIAGRIAPEFGMTAAAMMAEQSKFDVGPGELMIAHTLMANSKSNVTLEQLFALHSEGFGWGQIAHGLDLKLGEVTAAMKSESNVAAGRAKADGKPARISSSAKVASTTKAGVHAGPATAGAATNVGVGVKVGN